MGILQSQTNRNPDFQKRNPCAGPRSPPSPPWGPVRRPPGPSAAGSRPAARAFFLPRRLLGEPDPSLTRATPAAPAPPSPPHPPRPCGHIRRLRILLPTLCRRGLPIPVFSDFGGRPFARSGLLLQSPVQRSALRHRSAAVHPFPALQSLRRRIRRLICRYSRTCMRR